MNLKRLIPNILFYGSIIFYGAILFEFIVMGFESSYGICRLIIGVECDAVSDASFLYMLPFIFVHVLPISLIIIFYYIKKRFHY